ncbi:DUF1801 domain-containing protein [Niabella drilacis]|uniref:YdhG-like domain-containing protein n=1 Tax=Niabella drilacis (strain DSM 25811 / CCM 8410 / CCUG 62505 / LMG 26954 / E90) TaxID=1285928 RepID=A0A1G6LA92_NIADE|nr:DUF1801 domain-containing protein [Niabella drilacis]SDC39476.1 protein of unknown function (DU1801) [Niabella drilacis]
MNALDEFYAKQEEPVKSCLLALRTMILLQDTHLTAARKYGMPFFCYKGKMCCYLWIDKKLGQPYLGIVEGKHMHHPLLKQEQRARMKPITFDPGKDLPVKAITQILQDMLRLYHEGIIKTK